eukprot:5495011-Amphidinium_carterae.1
MRRVFLVPCSFKHVSWVESVGSPTFGSIAGVLSKEGAQVQVAQRLAPFRIIDDKLDSVRLYVCQESALDSLELQSLAREVTGPLDRIGQITNHVELEFELASLPESDESLVKDFNKLSEYQTMELDT